LSWLFINITLHILMFREYLVILTSFWKLGLNFASCSFTFPGSLQ
jgi:hypothetical protein